MCGRYYVLLAQRTALRDDGSLLLFSFLLDSFFAAFQYMAFTTFIIVFLSAYCEPGLFRM